MSVYKVEDMTCGHCVATIESAVKTLDGSAAVTIDLAAKTVTVESKAAPDAVRAVIDDAGYTAVPMPG